MDGEAHLVAAADNISRPAGRLDYNCWPHAVRFRHSDTRRRAAATGGGDEDCCHNAGGSKSQHHGGTD